MNTKNTCRIFLAMFLVVATVLMTILCGLTSVPAMAAETDNTYYMITVKSTKHGDVKVDQDAVLQAGNHIKLTVEPDDGYKLLKLTVSKTDGSDIPVLTADEKEITSDYPDIMQICMPESNVIIEAQFVSEDGDASTSDLESDTEMSEEAKGNYWGAMSEANTPLAVSLNNASLLATYSSLKLTKTSNQFANYHTSGGLKWNCTESILWLGGTAAWCVEPSVNIGGDNLDYYSQGNGMQWFKDTYGWSYTKTMNLTKAVCLARNTYSDWKCNIALVQDLIWSEVDGNDRRVLTNGGGGTAVNCTHLDTLDKVNQAIKDVWNRFYKYNTLPSFDKSTVYVTPGQNYWLADSNKVVGDTAFTSMFSGVSVTKGSNGDGITIKADNSAAGKTGIIKYYKTQIPIDANAVMVYGNGSHQKAAIFNGTINPTYGAIRVVVSRTSYMKAHYIARDKIAPSLDIHIVKTDVDTGKALAGATFDIYMDGKKVDSVTTGNDGTVSYHWRGSEVWTDYVEAYESVLNMSNWKTAYEKAKKTVQDSLSTKVKDLKNNTKHTWKVVETASPKGYKLNDKVFEQTLSANTTAIEVSFADEPDGYITLKKTSGNESITKDNSCYDLSGAVYGVYETENDAKNDTNRKATLTTDSDGNTNVEVCGTGTRYVKELTAAKGYLLCDGTHDNATGGIHKIEVTTDNNDKNPAVVNCTEPVGNDPFVLQLHKMDYDTGEASAVGDAGLQGAIFELDYYTNTDGKTTGTPTRKWYFKTNEKGILFCSNESYLVSNYTMNNGTVLKSDSLFKDTDTGNVIYPIGSYRIKEVVPPLDYQNVGTMNYVEDKTGRTDVTTGLVAIIKQDSNGENPHIYDGNKKIQGNITASNLAINIYDKVYKGSISVVKKDANDNTTPIAGAKYKLVGQTDGKTYTGTTDANGKVSWSNLIPQNYTLTELSTPDGYSLLKDNVNVKIPMELTLDEINKSGADIKKSVFDETSQMYCFYDLSYTIGESVTPPFPSTGADQHLLFLLLIGALAVTGTGVILFMKKSKKHDDDDLPRGIYSKK